MKKSLKVSLWTIAMIVMIIVGTIGFSYVYFHNDVYEIENERVSDLPPYYRSIAGSYCAQVFPGIKTGMWRDCCIASLRDMAFDGGAIAPFAFTDSPSRGCEAGTYVRKKCSGSLEWCETVSLDPPMITMESVSYLEKDLGKTERDKRILALLADANMEADFMTGIRIEEDSDEHVRGRAFFKYDWNKNADFTAVRKSEGDWVIKVEQLVKTDELENVRDLIDGEYAFTPIDTSDWKTYRNEDVGFEVKIPKDWFCGGVALAPNLKTQHVCLEEKEKKNYYDGKITKQNLIMFNRGNSDGELLRESVDLEKKKGAKIYTVLVDNKTMILTIDEYYIQVFDASGRWLIVGFSAVDRKVFGAFVANFKFIQ